VHHCLDRQKSTHIRVVHVEFLNILIHVLIPCLMLLIIVYLRCCLGLAITKHEAFSVCMCNLSIFFSFLFKCSLLVETLVYFHLLVFKLSWTNINFITF
jgi:hypothetical protein